MKGVNMFLAEGFEDIEALAVRDVLIRGGVDVRTVGIGGNPDVSSSHGLTVFADGLLSETEDDGVDGKDDMMIFPGGMPGSRNLGECKELIKRMNRHYSAGGSLAAICAAPAFVLGQLDGIEDAVFTCYDGCETALVEKGAHFFRSPYIKWGRIITGRGPGHAVSFALGILGYLKGVEVARRVSAQMTLVCD